MVFQSTLAGDLFPANLAYHGHVHLDVMMFLVLVVVQARQGLERFVAEFAIVFRLGLARKKLVVGVTAVGSEPPRVHEVLPTNFTLERSLVRVEKLVFDGVGAYPESFSADFALVFGRSFVHAHVGLQAILGGVLVVA